MIIPGVYRTWVEYRSRSQALDVLRVYTEKGQEPPASVTSAIVPSRRPAPLHQCRAGAGGCLFQTDASNHLAHVAGRVVGGLGAAGIAWWRMPDNGEPGALVIWAVVVAIFFAGSSLRALSGCSPRPADSAMRAAGSAMADDDSALIDEIRDGSERAFNVLIDLISRRCAVFYAACWPTHRRLTIWHRRRSWWHGHGRGPIGAMPASDPGCAQSRGVKPGTRSEPGSVVVRAKPGGPVTSSRSLPLLLPNRRSSPALAALPLEQRAAVVLCVIQDFSHAQAAGILGAPLGTVKSHVARGKARLFAYSEATAFAPAALRGQRHDREPNGRRRGEARGTAPRRSAAGARSAFPLRRPRTPRRRRFRRQLAVALTFGAVSALRSLVSPLLARVTQTVSRAFVD